MDKERISRAMTRDELLKAISEKRILYNIKTEQYIFSADIANSIGITKYPLLRAPRLHKAAAARKCNWRELTFDYYQKIENNESLYEDYDCSYSKEKQKLYEETINRFQSTPGWLDVTDPANNLIDWQLIKNEAKELGNKGPKCVLQVLTEEQLEEMLNEGMSLYNVFSEEYIYQATDDGEIAQHTYDIRDAIRLHTAAARMDCFWENVHNDSGERIVLTAENRDDILESFASQEGWLDVSEPKENPIDWKAVKKARSKELSNHRVI